MATGPSHSPLERVAGGCERSLCRVAEVEKCRHVIAELQGLQQDEDLCVDTTSQATVTIAQARTYRVRAGEPVRMTLIGLTSRATIVVDALTNHP